LDREGTWQEAHAAAEHRLRSIRTLTGNGRLSIETPETAQSGSFSIAMRKPDSLYLQIQGPFGIKVGSAIVTRDTMRFYSALENRLYIGSSNANNLRRVFRFEVSFDDLMDLLSGGGFFSSDQRKPDSIFVEEDTDAYVYSVGASERRYLVDDARNIRRILFRDDRRRIILDESFGDTQSVDGIAFPFTLRLIRPVERQMLSLRFRSIQLNVPAEFSFRTPANAEVIRWH
jgi:outer membrane lipoprotein-sorting protein